MHKLLGVAALGALLTFLILPSVGLADISSTDATVSPDTIMVGEDAVITLSLSGVECTEGGNNVDVALVIDRSGSMNDETKIEDATDAAAGFLDRMNLPQDQAAIVSFNTSASVDASLGSDRAILDSALAEIRRSAGDGTAIGLGITAGTDELLANQSNEQAALIILSDGRDDPTDTDPAGKAQNACTAGIQVFAVGLGGDVDDAVMQNIPCNGGTYINAPTSAELDKVYQDIADVILGPIATNVNISDTVPSGLSIASGSASNGGEQAGPTVSWRLDQVQNGMSVSYTVVGDEPGTYTLGPASLSYMDCAGEMHTVDFPPQTLTVLPTTLPETGASSWEIYLRSLTPPVALLGLGIMLILLSKRSRTSRT